MQYTLVAKVGPELAQKWLAVNMTNRHVRQAVVEKYTYLMQKGEWRLTHQGIAFDTQDHLIDGQHRLLAIVKSGVTVPLAIARNVDDSGYLTIDQATKRSDADNLRIPKRNLEICKTLCRHGRSTHFASHGELAKLYDYFALRIIRLLESCGSACRVFSSANIRAAAIMSIEYGQPEKHVFNVYKNLVHLNFNSSPQVASALSRQYLGNQATFDLYVRGIITFNQPFPLMVDIASLSKIIITNERKKTELARLRKSLESILA